MESIVLVLFLQSPPQPRPMAFEYSDGYRQRAKVHRYASMATLPLFAAQAYLGRRLYTDLTGAGSATRTAHRATAIGIGGLFGLESVTGVWNLIEARKDPHRSAKRTAHAVLMLAADAGFMATVATRPTNAADYQGAKRLHRSLAIGSIGAATAGYLLMLFGR
jgi:hypothetical protein